MTENLKNNLFHTLIINRINKTGTRVTISTNMNEICKKINKIIVKVM